MSESAEASAAPDAAARRPMRVAWVAGGETIFRLAAVLKPLAISLMDELVPLVVVCPRRADVAALPQPPVDVVRYALRPWWPVRGGVPGGLASELSGRRIELLHALDAEAVPLTRRLSRALELPYVVSSYDAAAAGHIGRLDERARAVLAASDRIQQGLLERRVAPADRVFLRRPGVVRVRRPTCFVEPDKATAIVAGGELDEARWFEPVLRAFAALHAHGRPCVFAVIGSGRGERRLRRSAASLGLSGELTFVPAQPAWQLTGILKDADLFVAPVPTERVNLQALQALASGVPVLSTVNPASDFLRDGRTCLGFAPEDADALTVALSKLVDDHAEAGRLAEAALAYVGAHHAPDAAAEATAKVYRSALLGPGQSTDAAKDASAADE
ncbi:MAG: glycosyltransferase [Planctomycetota bacterium]